MILTDQKILSAMETNDIVIRPFRRDCLGSNSYDVHLAQELAVYESDVLDCRIHNEVRRFLIPNEGLILVPNRLYLGVTEEYTETNRHVPFLEGKSSIGRLGIDIHSTAGKGDIGYRNTWTLEISVKQPVRIYAGMPIGQLIYFEVSGQVHTDYSEKKTAKYKKLSSSPVESKIFLNFE